MRTRTEKQQLVAQMAMAGLKRKGLCVEERADFYEGLSGLLTPPAAEAARYAANCLRECERAEEEIAATLEWQNE
jgi:uncharacterized protein (DUF2336 family)